MRRTLMGLGIMLGAAAAALAQTSTPPTPPPPKTWVDYTTVKADVRYRFERIDDESKTNAAGKTFSRNRDRIRARLGVEVKPNDLLKVGIGISTGQSDPISGNQTIGDGFGKKEARLELGYLDYSLFGERAYEVHAFAGKMKNPFLTLPDDLIWDGDATPEGLALRGQYIHGPITYLANAAYQWIQERNPGSEAQLIAGQAALRVQFMPEILMTAGGAYYAYQRLRGYDVIDWEGKDNAYGNSTVAGTVSGTTTHKAWATGFKPVVYFGQVDFWPGEIPGLGRPMLSLYAHGISNTWKDASGEPVKYKAGQMFGMSLGKAKNPRTAELGYSYTKLEKDATPGLLTDSDRYGGGTDGKGHKIYMRYQIAKGLQAAVTYFDNKRKISDPKATNDYQRLQVDVQAAF